MSSLIVLLSVIVPGYLAVKIGDFVRSRRNRTSGDVIADASVLGVVVSCLYVLVMQQSPFPAGFGTDDSPAALMSTDVVEALGILSVMALVLYGAWTWIFRSSRVRSWMRSTIGRTVVEDILHDRLEELDNWARRVAKQQRKNATDTALIFAKLSSGQYVRGRLDALTDLREERAMMLRDVTLYRADLDDPDSLDFMLIDGQRSAVAPGAGMFVRLGAVEWLVVGVDENAFLKYLASRGQRKGKV